jgi:hypothetical protein
VELNPSDVGSQDRYVVQEVIKELAKNRPLDVAGAAHTSRPAGWGERQAYIDNIQAVRTGMQKCQQTVPTPIADMCQ